MELQKGICFLCYNASVIKDTQSQKISDLITFLLPKEINSTEFIRVQAALKLCPICYHKLIIAKCTSKNVKTDISNDVSNCCIMCKSETNLFQINSWPNFNAISEGMVFSKNNNCVTCSECLFYLDTKNNLKTKLLSKYPELQNKRLNNNETKRKWKLKFSPNIKLQSTPLRERNKYKSTSKKRKLLEIEDSLSESENSSSKRNINLDAIKKFKPLKNFKLYKNHKVVKIDSKFLNQVPYVLVSTSDLSDIYKSTFSENDMTKCNKDNSFMETSHQNISPVSLEDENFKVRNDSDTITKNDLNGIQKYLVVNISRMNMDKYLVSNESDQEVQNSIGKLDTSQSSNDTEEDIGLNDSLTENNDNIAEEVEASFEVKNKRKSVSFAEDKNVEIEYFENNSEKQRNHNSVGENSEVVGKKLSKGILKREENVGEGKETSEKQNEGQSEEVDELDEESNENVQSNKHEHVSLKATKLKLMNRRNSYLIDENSFTGISDSEDDDLSILNKSKIQEITDVILLESDEDDAVEDENASQKGKERRKAKPKSLERKKKQATALEVSPDDVEQVDKDRCITSEDNGDKIDNSEAATDEQSEDTALEGENTGEDNDNTSIVPTPSVDKEKIENGNVKTDKPKPLSKNEKSNEATKDLDEEICCEGDLDSREDDGLNKEETESTKTISGSDSTVREVCSEANDQDDIHDDKIAEKDSGEDDILNNTEKPTGIESESDLNSSQESILTKDTNVSELCKEVLNENVADTISVEHEENDLTSVPASSKSDAISDSDLTRLVNKYLNDPDTDNTPKEDTSNSLDKHCGEELINGSNVTDDIQKTDCSTSTPCNEFSKNDELGISEDDNENINSLLSNIFPSDVDEINSSDETKKRKVSDDELNISKEKKKKKVSFCNDVT